jgi:hypothetical protein
MLTGAKRCGRAVACGDQRGALKQIASALVIARKADRVSCSATAQLCHWWQRYIDDRPLDIHRTKHAKSKNVRLDGAFW